MPTIIFLAPFLLTLYVYVPFGGTQVSPTCGVLPFHSNDDSQPWLAQITDRSLSNKACYGLLVHDQWVLTLATCVSGASGVDVSLNQGLVRRFVTSGQIFTHPNYINDINNIAILAIDSVRLDNLNPVCIPASCDDNRYNPWSSQVDGCSLGTITEWSQINIGSVTPSIRSENVSIFPQRRCEGRLNKDISETQICGIQNRNGNCITSNGAPLVCRDSLDRQFIVGLLLVNSQECNRGFPSVFTRICSFQNWMISVMNNSENAKPTTPMNNREIITTRALRVTKATPPSTGIPFFHYSDSATSILEMICGPVPVIANGAISLNSFNVGAIANITCNPGYYLQGDPTIICQANGYWSAPEICIEKGIRFPPPSPSSSSSSSSSSPLPECHAIQIENGLIYPEHQLKGTVICASGYRPFGNVDVACVNGEWQRPAICVKVP